MRSDDVTQRLRALYVEHGDATLIEAAETIAALRQYRDAVTLANARLHTQIRDLEARLMSALCNNADRFSTRGEMTDADEKRQDSGPPEAGPASS